MSTANISTNVGGHSNKTAPPTKSQRYDKQTSVANPATASTKPLNGNTPQSPVQEISQIRQMIDEMNQSVSHVQKSLHFQVHEASGQVVVEVQDKKTGEVIKSIPPQELLDSMDKIHESIGAILDTEG